LSFYFRASHEHIRSLKCDLNLRQKNWKGNHYIFGYLSIYSHFYWTNKSVFDTCKVDLQTNEVPEIQITKVIEN